MVDSITGEIKDIFKEITVMFPAICNGSLWGKNNPEGLKAELSWLCVCVHTHFKKTKTKQKKM